MIPGSIAVAGCAGCAGVDFAFLDGVGIVRVFRTCTVQHPFGSQRDWLP